MNFKKMIVGIGCSLAMLMVLMSQSIGVGPSSWSYRIALLSVSSLSNDGERLLIGCKNGEYFVLDRFGKIILNDSFEEEIHVVDIAENGNMIFGMENKVAFLDKLGGILLEEYSADPVLFVSMAKNGLYAVAGTERKIFLMSTREINWEYDVRNKVIWEPEREAEGLSEIFVSEVAISATGSTVIVAAQQKVFLFDSTSSTCRAVIDLKSIVTSLAILPDGKEIVIGTEEGAFYVYDTEDNRKFSDSRGGSINSITVNSKQILVGTSKNKVVLFSRDGDILGEWETEGSIDVCDISDDGKFMVVLDSESNVSSFNIETERGRKFTMRDLISVELSKNGKYIVITKKNGVYFLNNWEHVFDGTEYFPYASHGFFSLENDLHMLWSYPMEINNCIDYGDVNGDGWNEVIFGSSSELVVVDYRGMLVWKRSFHANIEIVQLLDLTEDSIPEIFIGFDDGRLSMDVWSGEGRNLDSFDFNNIFYIEWRPGETSIEPIAAMDIDQDGIIEIISGVKIAYTLSPGGIFVFEYPSGEKQWFYPIAPFEANRALIDISNDGSPELILGSRSLCRGTIVGKRDDCHIYVMVIDLEGKELWVEEIGSGSKLLLVGVSDLNRDRRKEIVCTVSSPENNYGKLFILDSNGKNIHEKEFDYSIWLGGIADFEKDGFQEIVVTNSEGRVEMWAMYNCELVKLRDFESGQNTVPYVEGIADLDGNETLEIISVTDSGKLIILDSDFAELTSLEFDEQPHVMVANISGCALNLLVRFSDRIELYSLKNERTHLCFLIEEEYSIPTMDPDTYFVLAETYYENLYFRKAKESYEKAKTFYEAFENIDRILESNRMFERTEDLCDALDEICQGKEKMIKEDFENAMYDFLDAKILFEKLLTEETFPEVKEWLPFQISECENLAKECEELREAFDGFRKGKKELEKRNFIEAKEYFESALPTFEKYNHEQSSQQIRIYLEEIDEENRIKGYFSIGILISWILLFTLLFRWHRTISFAKIIIILAIFVSAILILTYFPQIREIFIFFQKYLEIIVITLFAGVIYIGWKYLPDMVYRNENYSAIDSLLYTLHIKKFPDFSQITNRYYVGNPIREDSMFFGREDVFESLKNRLTSPGRKPAIILYGEPRTGKTSILYQIEDGKLELGPEFIPVYIDMNEMATNTDHEFFSTLSSKIQEAIEKHQIQIPAISFERRGNPYLFFRDNFLRNVVDSIGEKRILFLIDEYEVIDRKVVEERLSSDVFSFLKNVIEHRPKFNFIFAGSRKIEELRNFEQWDPILSVSINEKISFLKREDATKLIKDPVAEKVWCTDRAVNELLDTSGCHPYILQYLCHNLIALLNENSSYTIDTKEVVEVVKETIENPMPQMMLLWKTFTQDRQILVSFLAEAIQKKGGSISEKKVIISLKKKNIKLKNAVAVLHDLEDRDILGRERNKYEFCVDIFRQFVAEHYPLSRVLQEAGP